MKDDVIVSWHSGDLKGSFAYDPDTFVTSEGVTHFARDSGTYTIKVSLPPGSCVPIDIVDLGVRIEIYQDSFKTTKIPEEGEEGWLKTDSSAPSVRDIKEKGSNAHTQDGGPSHDGGHDSSQRPDTQ